MLPWKAAHVLARNVIFLGFAASLASAALAVGS
jgi:hypothetical protein